MKINNLTIVKFTFLFEFYFSIKISIIFIKNKYFMEFPSPKSNNLFFIWKITSNEQLKYNYNLLKNDLKISFSITTICEIFENANL
jgi:hypothetical protein